MDDPYAARSRIIPPLPSSTSSPPCSDKAANLQIMTAQFIDGFVSATDKTSYLRLAGVPFEIDGSGGSKTLKLVDVEMATNWQVGTASPSFGSRDLSYLPFPGEMVSERTNMTLVYVSIDEKVTTDVRDFVKMKQEDIT